MLTIPGAGYYGPRTAPPGAKFAVVLMTVTNIGLAPNYVGGYSFRSRDSLGRVFTMDFPDDSNVQSTAEAYFGRQGRYDTIQPGLTVDMVFVFLTPADASGLVAERCPTTGC